MAALGPIYLSVSPTNICHVTDAYKGWVKVMSDNPYIHRFLAQTDEYNFIFVGFTTDEYNLIYSYVPLNIKKLMNE
jgi:hypothetical protein